MIYAAMFAVNFAWLHRGGWSLRSVGVAVVIAATCVLELALLFPQPPSAGSACTC